MDRRKFLKAYGSLPLAAAVPGLGFGESAPESAFRYWGLHPFLEAHPDAVFIRRTQVPSKDDAEAKKKESESLARMIFTLKKDSGIDLSHKVAFKPNLTSTKGTGLTHAICTDPYMNEGIIEGLKKLSIKPEQIYVREGLGREQPVTGFTDMARRTGVHYGDDQDRAPTTVECPSGVVFRRTKYLGPFAYDDSHLINISKLKTHSMGLTLCVKNLQGTNINPYIRFCGGLLKSIADDFQPDAQAHVDELFARHQKAGLPRWDTEKAAWMEMWIQRTIDHYALIKPKTVLHMIEGIYSQNGDGFDGGPGSDGTPDKFLTNLVIFGRDAFAVDIIGHWIGGHEPGNFGLFHIGRERGVSTALDPRNVPVYFWEDSGPRLARLEEIPRTPMSTIYLPRADEPRFHMISEPFRYPAENRVACLSGGSRPNLRDLGPAYASPGCPASVLELSLPREGSARVEVLDRHGDRLFLQEFPHLSQGIHMIQWNTARLSPGKALGRLSVAGAQVPAPLQLG